MAGLVPTAFSILTWNIYFAPHQWATWMQHILAECERLQPDVLCFQEVLPPFMALLQDEEKPTELMISSNNDENASGGRNSWLARNDYICSTLDPKGVVPYGVLTMVKRKHRPHFQSLDLPSRMGRRLLLTHLESMGRGVEGEEVESKGKLIEEWIIGNVHLESLDSTTLRAEQLRNAGVSLSLKEERINVVLCGDFNFCSERNYDIGDSLQSLENEVFPLALPSFQDLWPSVKKGTKEEKEGFTFDGTRNTLIRMPRPDPQMRYDRVLWRGTGRKEQQQQQQQKLQKIQNQAQEKLKGSMAEVAGRGWRPRDIRLVGTDPVKGGLFLSDHFGLLATFEKEQ